MSTKKFARIVPIAQVLNHHLTLRGFRFTESVFGTSIYVSATENDTGNDIIFTTGSVAIVELFKAFDDPEDCIGLQIAVRERGKSYLIEDLEEQ
jgi:hypothetical protein